MCFGPGVLMWCVLSWSVGVYVRAGEYVPIFFFLTFFMSHSRIMTSSMRQMRVTSADLVLDP